MIGDDDNVVRGIWLDEQDWVELCEKAELRCPFCCDVPEVENAQFFLEEGCCPYCSAVFDRMMRD